ARHLRLRLPHPPAHGRQGRCDALRREEGTKRRIVPMARHIMSDGQNDGVDRRGFLKCMAWAGTGLVWSVASSGLLTSCTLPEALAGPKVQSFSFVQISDNHIGFSAPGVNTDVTRTFEQVVARINALPDRPALVLHTGDLTQLAKPA